MLCAQNWDVATGNDDYSLLMGVDSGDVRAYFGKQNSSHILPKLLQYLRVRMSPMRKAYRWNS